jgi:hypothetical protein
MFKLLDQSPHLSKLISRISTLLAKQRGLPVVIGIVVIVVGFGFQLIAAYTGSRLLDILGLIAHNLGVLIALIGLLLADPLGK